jgi:hypothetical protein
MADSEEQPKSKQKSDIESPSIGDENFKTFGGMPDTKKVDAIEKVNLPSGRKRAPDAAGF